MDFNSHDSSYLFISRKATTTTVGMAGIDGSGGSEGVTLWN